MEIVTIVIVAFAGLWVVGKVMKNRKIQELRNAYSSALSGTNKQAALIAGRSYYAALRKGGVLTSYDEAAINNDIAAMNV